MLSDSLISPVISVKMLDLKGLFPKSRHLNYTIKNDIYYLFYYLFIYKILHNTGKKRIIEGKSLRKEEYYGG